MARKLLVLDTSYAFEAIRERKLYDSVTCRDLSGFFEHVWTVHPFGSLVSSEKTTRFGDPEIHAIAPAHTFVDGKVGRFDALSNVFLLNFALSQAALIVRLGALIRRENISVIRVGDPLYVGLLGLLLARRHRIPLVVRMNANYDKIVAATGRPMMPRFFRTYRVEKQVVRFVLSHADLVAAVNEDNLRFAIANGAREDRGTIFRYGNLIDKRHVRPPEERGSARELLQEFWSAPQRFLLHVGRLVPMKFPADPIEVLARVRAKGHDVKLLMVGDGDEREALGALTTKLGVEEHVVFCGNRDQDWLAKVIPMAATVLSPLTGRALSEVAFGAAPIVAYDLDWQGELVRTGETGELVPSRDLDAMANAVVCFLTDPDYARRMGAAVRERAFEMLDPDRLDQHERDQYTTLLARFGRERGLTP